MLILGDEGHYHGRFPWVTASLVVINVVVFVAQTFLGEPFTNGFSLVPGELTSFQDFKGTKYHKVKVEVPGHVDYKGHYHPRYETKQFPIKHYTGPYPPYLTLLSSMFMHGDFFHLIGNMWFLLVFGRNVECALDHGRYLAFYIACGICAGLAHVASDPHAVIPCLGASGAISGVLGAYIAIHPLNKIKVWFGWMIGVIEFPALVVIGVWFLVQYLSAFMMLEEEGMSDNVAYWNHLGGFTAGFIIIRGMAAYLRLQQLRGELTEAEPLLAADDAPTNTLPPDTMLNPAEIGVKSGAPDPFATFLSIETISKAREPAKQEQPARS